MVNCELSKRSTHRVFRENIKKTKRKMRRNRGSRRERKRGKGEEAIEVQIFRNWIARQPTIVDEGLGVDDRGWCRGVMSFIYRVVSKVGGPETQRRRCKDRGRWKPPDFWRKAKREGERARGKCCAPWRWNGIVYGGLKCRLHDAAFPLMGKTTSMVLLCLQATTFAAKSFYRATN